MHSECQSIWRRSRIGAALVLMACASAQGQQMRFYPVRMAPRGSPVGGVGNAVAPDFNPEKGCWEVVIPSGGVEVDLEIQAFGWSLPTGDPLLGAVQATVDSSQYDNGTGVALVPKGWPDQPRNGAYLTRSACSENGNPCASPAFDPSCDGGMDGVCAFNPQWVMAPCFDDIPGDSQGSLDYAWAVAAVTLCDPNFGEVRSLGGLILEVPENAAGTYFIDFDPDPNASFFTVLVGNGVSSYTPELVPACITVERPDRNRYLTFDNAFPNAVAFRLDMLSSLFHPDATVFGWIGEPDAHDIARLELNPVVRVWDESVVHVTGCEITPAATFVLRPMLGDGTFLSPVTLQTTPQPADAKFWGDTVGSFNGAFWTAPQGVVNIDDVVGAIKSWQQADGAPSIPRSDVEPQEPNRAVNFNDVFTINLAFQGQRYPFGCSNDPCQDNATIPCP